MAEMALAGGFDPVVVVVGPHRAPIAHTLRDLPVGLVDAERWYEGRTSSIQSGLAALPPESDVLFWPVDHPFVTARTVERLRAAADHDTLAVWVLPTFQGAGGHPVLWRPPVRREIARLRSDAPVRSLLPEFGPQVLRIPVDDAGVVANVDTPEAYRAAHDAWAASEED